MTPEAQMVQTVGALWSAERTQGCARADRGRDGGMPVRRDTARGPFERRSGELPAGPRANYYRARAAIDHTWLIPNPEWETIRAHILTTGYAKTGIDWPRRHHLHSIWLWTLLTGGDLADAPHVRHASSVNPGTNQTAHATNNLIRRTRQSRRELINDIANDLRATF